MNANELAVYLEDITDWEESPYRQAATMLRQQQAEIDRAVELYTDKAIKVEQLEKELTEAGHMIGVLREYISDLENGLDSSINLNKAQAERNNEPVIWTACLDCGKRVTGDSIHTCSPQLRQLTDEEIRHIQAICHLKDVGYDNFIMRFARAILRKASEK